MPKYYLGFILLLTWLATAGGGKAQAQTNINGYRFQALAGTYTPLGSGATRLPALETNEAVVQGIPLGFAFAANGQFSTQASVSSNGWLHLGTRVLSGPLPGQYPNPASNIFWLATPLWADLSGTGGAAYYQTTGAAPNRVFTMEWRDWRWDQNAAQAVLSFQVKLYEASGQVAFSYDAGPGTVNNSGNPAKGVAGLQMITSTGSNLLLLLNSLSAAATVGGSVPAPILAKPVAGQQYTFTPDLNQLPACPIPQNARLVVLRRTTAQVRWTLPDVAGPVRVHYGLRGFVLGTAADAVATGTAADTAQLTGLLPSQEYEFLVEQECIQGIRQGFTSRQRFRTIQTPANDDGAQALLVPVRSDLRRAWLTGGTARYATASLPPVPGCGPAPAGGVRDVWYAFRATQAVHKVQVVEASTDFVLEVRDGWGTGSRSLLCGTTSPSQFWNGRQLQLTASGLIVGRTYFLRLYPTTGFRPDSQNDDYQDAVTLGVLGEQTPPVPANSTCAGALRLPVALTPAVRVPTAGTLTGAPETTIYNCIYGTSLGREVWYRFRAPGAQAEVYFHPQFDGGIEWTDACSPVGVLSTCAATTRRGVTRLALAGLATGRDYLLRVYAPAGVNFNPLSDSTFQIAVSGPPVAPANDNCAGSLVLPLTARGQVGQRGTLAGATTSGLAPATSCAWNGGGMAPLPPAEARDVWYRFTATAAAQVLTLSAATDAVMEVLGTVGGALPCAAGAAPARLGCANALGIDASIPDQRLPGRTLVTGLIVGQTYWVRVYAARLTTPIMPTGEPDFDLSLHDWVVPANDEPANALQLPLSPSTEPCTASVGFTLDGATPTLPPATATDPPSRDVWFAFAAPAASGSATFSGVAVRFNFSAPLVDGLLELRDLPGPGGQVLSGTGTSVGIRQIGESGLLYQYLVPGRTYYVRVSSRLPSPEPQPNFSICLAPLIVNDEPCGALPLPLNATGQCVSTVRGTIFGASTSQNNNGVLLPVSNCGGSNSTSIRDVWYRVVPSGPAFTLRCDDISLDLARLYQPVSAQDCAGAMRLVGCQSSQQLNSAPRPLGELLFDQLTPGQPYYLALSGDAPFVLTSNFTLCTQAALSLPTRSALGRGAYQAWPNPVPAGQVLNLELRAPLSASQTLRFEWLNTLGQLLPGSGTGHVESGRLQIPTAGRQPGLYLLRVWPSDGLPLAPVRVVVE